MNLTKNQMENMKKLQSDMCYIVRPNNTWYIATMCNLRLIELQKLGLVAHLNGLLTNQMIESASANGKLCIIKFKQDEYAKYTSFFGFAERVEYKLDNVRVYTFAQINELRSQIFSILKTGYIDIDGQIYTSYERGITTSGGIFLRTIEGEIVELSYFSMDIIKPAEINKNASLLLNNVCKYKGDSVTLNYSILERYYGNEIYLLESKGVRYRMCYYEILCGGSVSAIYLKNKYGIEEDCATVDEVFNVVSKYKSRKSSKSGNITARRLLPQKQIKYNHKSLYVSIPEDAELTVSGMQLHKVYVYNSNVGYISFDADGSDINTTKANARDYANKVYGGETEVLTIMTGGSLIYGLKSINNFTYNKQVELWRYINGSYTDNIAFYSPIINNIAINNNLGVIDETAIKYIFINNLAKKSRKSRELKLCDCTLSFIKFLDLVSDKERYEESLSSSLKPICLKHLTEEFKKIQKNEIVFEGGCYKCEYGRIFRKSSGELCKLVELWYGERFVGKSVISS